MMHEVNIDQLIKSCDTIGRRCTQIGDGFHGSVWLFNACMRAFTNAHLPAEAVTYEVYINAPVMKPGRVTIHRDGSFEMHTIKEEDC